MTGRPLRILYVGYMAQGGTCRQRMEALRELGHCVHFIDSKPGHVCEVEARVWRRALRKFFWIGPTDFFGLNQRIVSEASREAYDVLWVDKGLAVRRDAIEQVKLASPKTVIVGYSPDDMAARHNQSRDFLAHLPLYDLFFTTKSYGVAELRALGCHRVTFVANAFDLAIHKPVPVTEEDRKSLGGPVGFIGDFEADRAAHMLLLAEAGVLVRVWGPHWERLRQSHPNLRIEGRPIWAEEYAKAICAFDINLGFLRKINRDLQTTRSVEIPACGAFLLAERTSEHQQLFQEGQEAEFFDSADEMVRKVRYYLGHAAQRRRIAAAGRERCLASGYSNLERMRKMVQEVASLI